MIFEFTYSHGMVINGLKSTRNMFLGTTVYCSKSGWYPQLVLRIPATGLENTGGVFCLLAACFVVWGVSLRILTVFSEGFMV